MRRGNYLRLLKRYVSGEQSLTEIRWHLFILVVGYWGLVLCAWLGYPARNHFSIFSQMLSALGSFDDRFNPKWYWVFSLAMLYCGLGSIPIVLYVRRRISSVSPTGAFVGAIFYLASCLAMSLTGLFPFAHQDFFGWQLWRLHLLFAGLIFIFFALGTLCHGAILLVDRYTQRNLIRQGLRTYLPVAAPFFAWFPAIAIVAPRMHWRRLLTGDMEAVLQGINSFTFSEHITIWTLMVFLVWFTLALPHAQEQLAQASPSGRIPEK